MTQVAQTTLAFSDVFKWEVGTDVGYCREVKDFVGTTDTTYEIGTLVKKSGDNLVPAAAADAANVVGVLAEKVDATGSAQEAVFVVRGPILVGNLYLSFSDTATDQNRSDAVDALQAIGIKVATQL